MKRVTMTLLCASLFCTPIVSNALELNDRVETHVLLENVKAKSDSKKNVFSRFMSNIFWKPLQHTLMPVKKRGLGTDRQEGWDMSPNDNRVNIDYHFW